MFNNSYFETPAWTEYLKLQNERPQAFAEGPCYRIITDQAAVLDFMNKNGREIGVLYKSGFSYLVVDLVDDGKGGCFAYERVLPFVSSGAVVIVPHYGDRFVLLRQFRHAIRQEQIAFPRGFGEQGLDSTQNAAKEIAEELGAVVTETRHLGKVTADSGLVGNMVDIVECKLETADNSKSRFSIL